MVDASWVDDLLSDTREVVLTLLDEPTIAGEALSSTIRAYTDTLRQAARPTTDLELGLRLAEAHLDLLAAVADGPAEDRKLAQVAARYLVQDLDEDIASPFGFDDDIEVFNTVAERLGRTELLVTG